MTYGRSVIVFLQLSCDVMAQYYNNVGCFLFHFLVKDLLGSLHPSFLL